MIWSISGGEAFEPRDKLARTPQTRPRVPVYPADYNSLLNDSLTHMPSPLSSTRIEQAAIDRQDARDLATKLFDDNSGRVLFLCLSMLLSMKCLSVPPALSPFYLYLSHDGVTPWQICHVTTELMYTRHPIQNAKNCAFKLTTMNFDPCPLPSNSSETSKINPYAKVRLTVITQWHLCVPLSFSMVYDIPV